MQNLTAILVTIPVCGSILQRTQLMQLHKQLYSYIEHTQMQNHTV